MRSLVFALAIASLSFAQDPGAARTYLVKLSIPVSTKQSKPGDRIRAAIISPESLLNGYLEGSIEEAASRPAGRLVLRFNNVLYKGKSTSIRSEVVDFVNSKGHKSVDDDERPIKLEQGAFTGVGSELWLDEGAELRVRAEPPQK